MKKILSIFLVLVLIFAVTSCKKDKNATLSLKDQSIELKVGDSYTINPTIAEAKDTSFNVELIGDSSVLEIKDNVITAKQAGEVTVKVSLKSNPDASSQLTVKVRSEDDIDPAPTEIIIVGSSTLTEGEQTTLAVTLQNLEGTITFRSSDENIATVDGQGKVTAVKAGRVVITVLVGNESKDFPMEITAKQVTPPTSTLKLSGDDIVFVGKTITLKAEKTNLEGTYSYSSSDDTIATVTRGGIVKGISVGTVTITVECGGLTATKDVEVKALPVIEIATTAPDHLVVGETLDMKELLTLTNTTLADLEYKSSDVSAATISNDGIVTALKEGTTKITISYLSVKATLILDIYGPKVTITNIPTQLNVDEPYQLTYKVEYSTASVSFKSSNENVATVTNAGLINPIDVGTVTITATCDTATTSFTVTVKPGRITITYDFNGGYSEELLVAKASNEPKIPINSYNTINGGFWTNYSTDIFFMDKDHYMNATFSDRIFLAKDPETGLYKVIGFTATGSAPWMSDAEYAIVISNSYSGTHGGYNITIKPITLQIQVGDYVAFDGDFTTCKTGVEVNAYFYHDPKVKGSLVVEYKAGMELIKPGNLGYRFLGWYNGESLVEDISSLTKSVKLQAHWEALNPVTSLDIKNAPDELLDTDTLQLDASVVPSDAYFKTILYSSSDTTIFEVDANGLITAKNAGTATLTITDYLKNVVFTKEITIYPNKTITIDFDQIYRGYLPAGSSINVTPHAYGKGLDGAAFKYESSSPDNVTIDNTGKITAVANGTSTITISIVGEETVNITFLVTVKEYGDDTEIDKLVKLLVDNNFGQVEYGNVSLYNDGKKRVYDSIYGSVNRYLFDPFTIHRDYESVAVNTGTSHTTRRATDQIEFVCVHDTATLTGTVVSIASGMANEHNGGASIHYTVGNDAIYSVVPESLIAWHAGDGTGTPFEWSNSGVSVVDPTKAPTFGMVKESDTYYLTINGTKSSITLPTSTITNETYKRLTYLGPTWKVVDGKYYIGTIWYSKDYGYLSSHGGNNNSIGIEMNVNLTNDIYDTWQRTGQLVADILIRNNLDLTRVKMHNTFSGKNCPQCILSAGNWDMFMEFVAINYEIMTKYPDAKISIKSNNPDILDDTGRIFNPPLLTTEVSYDLTVELGGESRTVTLHSIVAGTTTWEQWDGEYLASDIWNNGHYSLVK